MLGSGDSHDDAIFNTSKADFLLFIGTDKREKNDFVLFALVVVDN